VLFCVPQHELPVRRSGAVGHDLKHGHEAAVDAVVQMPAGVLLRRQLSVRHRTIAQPRLSHCGRPAPYQVGRRLRQRRRNSGSVHCLDACSSRPDVSIAKHALGPSGLRSSSPLAVAIYSARMVTSCLREDRKTGATARASKMAGGVVGGSKRRKDYGLSSRICEGALLTPAKWADVT
jgi:hypothetical protein